MTSCNNLNQEMVQINLWKQLASALRTPTLCLDMTHIFTSPPSVGRTKQQILKLGHPSLLKPPCSAWGELAELWGIAWGKPRRAAFTFYTSGPSTPLLFFLSLKSYALCLKRTILEEAAHKSKCTPILLFPLLCVLWAVNAGMLSITGCF